MHYELAFRDTIATRVRRILIRPDHAYDGCMRAERDLYRDTGRKGALWVLGFETYWNLVADLAIRMQPHPPAYRNQYSVPLDRVPHLSQFLDIPIFVDPSEVWSVKILPELQHAWPTYGQDDTYERWPVEAKLDPSCKM